MRPLDPGDIDAEDDSTQRTTSKKRGDVDYSMDLDMVIEMGNEADTCAWAREERGEEAGRAAAMEYWTGGEIIDAYDRVPPPRADGSEKGSRRGSESDRAKMGINPADLEMQRWLQEEAAVQAVAAAERDGDQSESSSKLSSNSSSKKWWKPWSRSEVERGQEQSDSTGTDMSSIDTATASSRSSKRSKSKRAKKVQRLRPITEDSVITDSDGSVRGYSESTTTSKSRSSTAARQSRQGHSAAVEAWTGGEIIDTYGGASSSTKKGRLSTVDELSGRSESSMAEELDQKIGSRFKSDTDMTDSELSRRDQLVEVESLEAFVVRL